MNEPTLYQKNPPATETAATLFDLLLKWGVLVSVERCEHGYLDEHQWYNTFCPGAGIGGDGAEAPRCNSENGIFGQCACKVPCFGGNE